MFTDCLQMTALSVNAFKYRVLLQKTHAQSLMFTRLQINETFYIYAYAPVVCLWCVCGVSAVCPHV